MRKNIRHSFLAAAGVVALAGGAALASAPAAQAAPLLGCASKHACVYEHANRGGAKQSASGFVDYTDLNRSLQDRASSWTNANDVTTMVIGEWRGRQKVIGQKLPAQWYESNLKSVGFNDRADWVSRNNWI